MKLLVTADLHLSEGAPERLEGFRWLLERGSEEDVDAALVGGDMFDDNRAYRELKGELGSIMEETGGEFPVLTVPGNHDDELTRTDYPDHPIRVLDEEEGPIAISADETGLQVFGLPYRERGNGALQGKEAPGGDQATVLLTHGSLIDPKREYVFRGITRQGEEHDHLLFREELEETGYDCVVLGHWHRPRLLEGEDTDFLYPGSPLPVGRDELGEKYYWLLKSKSGGGFDFSKRPFTWKGSWYNREESLFSVPNHEAALPEELYDLLDRIEEDRRCALRVEVDGYASKRGELELKGKLERVADEFEDRFYDLQLVWNVSSAQEFDSPLLKGFIEEIEEVDRSDLELESFLEEDQSRYADLFREVLEEDFEGVKRRALRGSLKVLSQRLD